MAAAVETFEPFRTPNLFEASISADPNHVDSYFSDKMDVERPDCFDAESWSIFPPTQGLEEQNDFSVNAESFSYTAITTPPPSAKEQPSDWPVNPSKQHSTMFANPLHQIDTSQPSLNARFDWGQPTPPNEQGSPAGEFPTVSEDIIKQDPDAESSKTVPARRRKSEDQPEGPKKRRSRKSISTISSVDASADPVEEERRNRFLERNRVAASKCRQKKKEWTQNLENHARDLHSNNHQLQVLLNSLKDEVMYLRSEMLKHGTCDCTGIRDYLSREADFLASGGSPRSPASQHSKSASSRHSLISSPRHSIASITESRHNLDPVLHSPAEDSSMTSQGAATGRTGSVSSAQ